MQILKIDYGYGDWEYYKFPEHISTIEVFMQYASENYHSFIPMTQYSTENCVFPYLIEEETKTVYVNISKIKIICVTEATILCRKKYDSLLKRVIQQKCVDCENYDMHMEGDNDQGYRDKLSLDGKCWGYLKKVD